MLHTRTGILQGSKSGKQEERTSLQCSCLQQQQLESVSYLDMVYQVLNLIHLVGLYSQLLGEPQETILCWPHVSPSKVHIFNLLILVYHTQHTQKGRRKKKSKIKRDKSFINSTQVKRTIQRN